MTHIEAVDAKKQNVSIEMTKSLFGNGAYERERILAQSSTGENDVDIGSGQLSRDVHRIGNHSEFPENTQCPGDSCGGGAGIQYDYLALIHHAGRSRSNERFFLAMQLLLLAKCRIFENAVAAGLSASVRAMQLILSMQRLEILANGYRRGPKTPGKVLDNNPAVAIE